MHSHLVFLTIANPLQTGDLLFAKSSQSLDLD